MSFENIRNRTSHLQKSGNFFVFNSSDEYVIIERKPIHPMTMMSKMDSTFQNMI
jgi:hypothetical protein